jgi:hypothetical protein
MVGCIFLVVMFVYVIYVFCTDFDIDRQDCDTSQCDYCPFPCEKRRNKK